MAPVLAFEPVAVMEAVDACKCTALLGVPTMFIAELEEMGKNKYDTSHLRTICRILYTSYGGENYG